MLILASASPQRLSLLKSVGINPDQIISLDLDETPLKKEKPQEIALRLALKKAKAPQMDGFIIGADTVVATKAKFFHKGENNQIIEEYLNFYSGRRIYIHTAVAVVKKENNLIVKSGKKLVSNTIKFKRFTKEEISYYLASNHGINTAGGINILGFGETLIQWMQGTYSAILGLPLYETTNLLTGMGYHDHIKGKS